MDLPTGRVRGQPDRLLPVRQRQQGWRLLSRERGLHAIRDYAACPRRKRRLGGGLHHRSGRLFSCHGEQLPEREISALFEAEAVLEQIPPGFLRDETEAACARLSKVRGQAFGKGELKERVRLKMSQLRTTSADSFATVLAALRSRRRLEFIYRSRSRDEEKARSASPLRLTFYRSNWYLAAWCHEREELRVFSVDRIARPRCMSDPVYDPPLGDRLTERSGPK